jgi:uncharacterized coiled-coil DUF342 family protein
VFLRNQVAPYYQRTEDMRSHRRTAEHQLEAAALRLKEAKAEAAQLRRELATARGEADTLRDAAAQARRVAA